MDFQFILLTTDNARLIDLHTFIGNFLYGVITSIYFIFSLSSFRHNFSTRDDSFSHPQAGIALHQIMNWFLSISIFHSVLTFIAIFIRDHTCPLSLIHTYTHTLSALSDSIFYGKIIHLICFDNLKHTHTYFRDDVERGL